MRVNGISEIPSGLMLDKINNPNNVSIENLYRRFELEDAVERADLNVTERMALNRKFYPNGGGFNLFPENVPIYKFNMYYKKGSLPEEDTFTKEIESLTLPEHVCRVQKRTYVSSKYNFSSNLDNAIKKLREIFKKEV